MYIANPKFKIDELVIINDFYSTRGHIVKVRAEWEGNYSQPLIKYDVLVHTQVVEHVEGDLRKILSDHDDQDYKTNFKSNYGFDTRR